MPKILILLMSCLLWSLTGCISVSLLPQPGPLQETKLEGKGSDKILVISISGLISSSPKGQFIEQPGLPAQVKEELEKAAEDSRIKAVVLRINSPGGTVTASDIIYHEIQAFKKDTGVPVIASIMDLGTSGGYYIALAGDRIVAHPSSVTGSLGVIMVTINAAGLLEKVGVEAAAITSGPYKDSGSPFRVMTAEERSIFQEVINSFHARFLEVIAQGRPSLTAQEIRQLADGRIYSAAQAYDLGLIDQIGYLDDAIAMAKQEAGLEEAKVVMYHRPRAYKHNIYSQWSGGEGALPSLAKLDALNLTRLLGGGPQFLYIWWP